MLNRDVAFGCSFFIFLGLIVASIAEFNQQFLVVRVALYSCFAAGCVVNGWLFICGRNSQVNLIVLSAGILVLLASMVLAGTERSPFIFALVLSFYISGFVFGDGAIDRKSVFALALSLVLLQIIVASLAMVGFEANLISKCIFSGPTGETRRCYIGMNEPSYFAFVLISLATVLNRTMLPVFLFALVVVSLSLKSSLLYFAMPPLMLLLHAPLSRFLGVAGCWLVIDHELLAQKLNTQLVRLLGYFDDLGLVEFFIGNESAIFLPYWLLFLTAALVLAGEHRRRLLTTFFLIALTAIKFDITNALLLAYTFGVLIGAVPRSYSRAKADRMICA